MEGADFSCSDRIYNSYRSDENSHGICYEVRILHQNNDISTLGTRIRSMKWLITLPGLVNKEQLREFYEDLARDEWGIDIENMYIAHESAHEGLSGNYSDIEHTHIYIKYSDAIHNQSKGIKHIWCYFGLNRNRLCLGLHNHIHKVNNNEEVKQILIGMCINDPECCEIILRENHSLAYRVNCILKSKVANVPVNNNELVPTVVTTTTATVGTNIKEHRTGYVKETTPTISTSTPTISTSTPTISTSTPTISTSTPTISTSTPTISTSTPTISTSTPTISTSTPTISTSTPTISTSTPTETSIRRHQTGCVAKTSSSATTHIGTNVKGHQPWYVVETPTSTPTTTTSTPTSTSTGTNIKGRQTGYVVETNQNTTPTIINKEETSQTTSTLQKTTGRKIKWYSNLVTVVIPKLTKCCDKICYVYNDYAKGKIESKSGIMYSIEYMSKTMGEKNVRNEEFMIHIMCENMDSFELFQEDLFRAFKRGWTGFLLIMNISKGAVIDQTVYFELDMIMSNKLHSFKFRGEEIFMQCDAVIIFANKKPTVEYKTFDASPKPTEMLFDSDKWLIYEIIGGEDGDLKEHNWREFKMQF